MSSRLDALLQSKFPQYSRSLIQKMIKGGQVTVSGKVQTKPSTTVTNNKKIKLDESSLVVDTPDIDLKILYEDDNCVVIDKPLGVLVHSKGAYNPEGTVASWLKGRKNYDFDEDSNRSGIVHRLDRATSGVMIAAKNKTALGHLQKQFQTRKAKKTYIARINGQLEPAHAALDLPIERNPKRPQTFRVGANGKSSQTEYKVIKEIDGDSILELKPTTGRTHQLRVHMTYLGHPIIGDTLYGGKQAERMYLHAAVLEITVPGGERKTFSSEVPEEFYD